MDRMSETTILIIEDEENILEAIKYNLEREGYLTLTATDGEYGLQLAREIKPTLVILDIMLPKLDGLQVCQLLRRDTNIPILMLTAKVEEVDRIVGLELGADDYVTKPFSMRELLARIKALLRRSTMSSQMSSDEPLQYVTTGNLNINFARHQVNIDGKPVNFTPREFTLLKFLVLGEGRTFTRNQILDYAWEYDYIGDTRTVDVHVRWLREKIEDNPSNPKRIITVRGVGYRFQK